MHSATHQTIAAVWRIESAKIVATVPRCHGGAVPRWRGWCVTLVAEELAQDALVEALEHWPKEGVPDKPGVWLTATARRTLDLMALP